MTNEQAKQFYREIGEVCQKHGIGAFVGWWINKDDGHGHFSYYNPLDEEMKQAALIMAAMVEMWEQQVERSELKGNIQDVITARPLDN